MNPCSMVGCTSTFSIGQSASSPLGSLPTPPPETLTMNKGINSQEDFFSFVKNTEDVSKVNFDEAQKLIQKGKCFLQHLREGAIKDCPREEGRALIIPLMWYLTPYMANMTSLSSKRIM